MGRNMAGFHRGLGETGFVEGRNVAIKYHWAEGRAGASANEPRAV